MIYEMICAEFCCDVAGVEKWCGGFYCFCYVYTGLYITTLIVLVPCYDSLNLMLFFYSRLHCTFAGFILCDRMLA